jgi:DNA-binding CsgD family transcriptional regulator
MADIGGRERVSQTLEAPSLLEREAELERLARFLDDACSGRGRLAVIEGAAGIGKTRLLEAARIEATARAMQVLRARASELERDFPFGVVRQLLEPRLVTASEEDRSRLLSGAAGLAARVIGESPARGDPASASADTSFGTLHGLYWLCANLAQESPLLLAVDDLHWADAASLRFFHFLVHRLEELPILLAVAARPAGPPANAQLMAELRGDSLAHFLRPAPLSTEAVQIFVRQELATAEEDFCRACHVATHGNPYLVRELVREVAAEGIPLTAAEAGRVRDLNPPAVAHAVLLRLARLSQAAVALGRAAAVLGANSGLGEGAALAGLEIGEARQAADDLATASILRDSRSLDFVHPMIRSAIYADIGPSERAAAHARAARLIVGEETDPTLVAGHLLLSEPAANPWVVEQLERAARQALSLGAPEIAVNYLRRALAEPPLAARRPELLLNLGAAGVRSTGDPESLDCLKQAFEQSKDPRLRAEAAGELAWALLLVGQTSEGVLTDAIAALPEEEREWGLRLEAELFISGNVSLAVRRLVTARPPRFQAQVEEPLSPADRVALTNLALEMALGRGSAAAAVELAEKALGEGRLLAEETSDSLFFYGAANALLYAGRLEEAHQAYGSALADARRRGSLRAFAMASCWRAAVNYRRGEIHAAEADARAYLDEQAQLRIQLGLPVALAFLVEVLIERGELADASSLVDEHAAALGAFSDTVLFAFFLHARGRLRQAQGRFHETIEDLHCCGRMLDAWGVRNPTIATWRASAAEAQLALAERDEARRLVGEELDRARAFGAPGPIGIALRASGLVEGGDTGLELLSEAVAVLERSPARLEYARALIDLGAALRRAGHRSEAQPTLRNGLDLARRCGAIALTERAHEELLAAGARPRRLAISGLESLTPCERRVAQLAAEGMTNRDIAQGLFVTVKTVEMHLSHTYRKLDIQSRAQLERTLAVDRVPQLTA